jgi:Sec-independent protein translocase protein TatA
VPIVWYPFERLNNFAHVFRDNAAKLHGALRGLPWAHRHAKLVVVTAEGLDVEAWNHEVLQPLTQLQLETWADFSSRLPATAAGDGSGYVPRGWQQQQQGAAEAVAEARIVEGSLQAEEILPMSAEGGSQRCFRTMFVCPAGLSRSVWPLHDLGLRLVKHYSSKLPQAGETSTAGWQRQWRRQAEDRQLQQQQQQQQEQQQQQGQPPQQQEQQREEEQEQRGAGMDRQAGIVASGASPAGKRVLRVLFQRRSSPDRQLINVKELLEQCNRWQFETTSGEQLAASCAEAETASLLTGMAAAQEADVFVGMHGANMANGWFMRPGSSMIELQPYGFDSSPAHLQYPLFNAMVSMCCTGAATLCTCHVLRLQVAWACLCIHLMHQSANCCGLWAER